MNIKEEHMQQFTLFVLWLSLKTDITAKLGVPRGKQPCKNHVQNAITLPNGATV